jgi:hypothetical protein
MGVPPGGEYLVNPSDQIRGKNARKTRAQKKLRAEIDGFVKSVAFLQFLRANICAILPWRSGLM